MVDTPGVRAVGLVDLKESDLSVHFPEFSDFVEGCEYADCCHKDEENCGIRDAVEGGDIPRARYESYLRLLESLSEA